jgi:tetratricopeptide (TPR) repeat protein
MAAGRGANVAPGMLEATVCDATRHTRSCRTTPPLRRHSAAILSLPPTETTPDVMSRMRRHRLIVALGVLAVCALAPGAKAQNGQRLALEAARAQSQGNLDQALTLLGEAIADAKLTNDRRAVILADRGALLARLNQPKAAIDDLNRAVLLYPEYPAIYNNRGSILLTLGLAREAIKDFDRAILLAPGYVAAYNNRAGARMLLGQTGGAIADFSRAIELTPDNVAPLAGRGLALLAANRPQAALRDFGHALQIDNRLALGYRNRAQARLVTDRTSEAIEDLSRAIAFDPANATIYLERGNAHMRTDNVAAALKDFAKAIELEPKSAPAYEARGLAHIKLDAIGNADADIQRAVELDPRSATALAARGLLYLKTGQADLARREIDRATRLAPQAAAVLLALGQIEETVGRREEALKAYRSAASQQPPAREAELALARLTGGAERIEVVELRGSGVDSWRLLQRGARLFAASDTYPRMQVPIEQVGDAAPRLTGFEIARPPNRDFAVLRYSTGAGRSGEPEAQYAAILDLSQAAVLAIVPDRLGNREAKWAWEDSRLVVTAADGLTDEVQLRGNRSGTTGVAALPPRRRYADGPATYTPPGWLPWSGPQAPPQQRRAQRPQRPKTLFDMIFGN